MTTSLCQFQEIFGTIASQLKPPAASFMTEANKGKTKSFRAREERWYKQPSAFVSFVSVFLPLSFSSRFSFCLAMNRCEWFYHQASSCFIHNTSNRIFAFAKRGTHNNEDTDTDRESPRDLIQLVIHLLYFVFLSLSSLAWFIVASCLSFGFPFLSFLKLLKMANMMIKMVVTPLVFHFFRFRFL